MCVTLTGSGVSPKRSRSSSRWMESDGETLSISLSLSLFFQFFFILIKQPFHCLLMINVTSSPSVGWMQKLCGPPEPQFDHVRLRGSCVKDELILIQILGCFHLRCLRSKQMQPTEWEKSRWTHTDTHTHLLHMLAGAFSRWEKKHAGRERSIHVSAAAAPPPHTPTPCSSWHTALQVSVRLVSEKSFINIKKKKKGATGRQLWLWDFNVDEAAGRKQQLKMDAAKLQNQQRRTQVVALSWGHCSFCGWGCNRRVGE